MATPLGNLPFVFRTVRVMTNAPLSKPQQKRVAPFMADTARSKR